MKTPSLRNMKKPHGQEALESSVKLPIELMRRPDGDKSWRDLVLIVASNDAVSLPSVIQETRAALPGADILVVDDGSVDGSGKVAKKAGAMVIRHPFKMGMGRSLQSGYRFALSHCCQRLVQMDSRGSDRPQDAAALLDRLRREDAEVVIASRYTPASGLRPTGLWERMAARSATAATVFLTGQRFSDPTSSLLAISRKVFPLLCKEGFPHDCPDTGLLALVSRAGYRVVEAPVTAMAPKREKTNSLRWAVYPMRMLVSLSVMAASQPTNRPVRTTVLPAPIRSRATCDQ